MGLTPAELPRRVQDPRARVHRVHRVCRARRAHEGGQAAQLHERVRGHDRQCVVVLLESVQCCVISLIRVIGAASLISALNSQVIWSYIGFSNVNYALAEGKEPTAHRAYRGPARYRRRRYTLLACQHRVLRRRYERRDH